MKPGRQWRPLPFARGEQLTLWTPSRQGRRYRPAAEELRGTVRYDGAKRAWVVMGTSFDIYGEVATLEEGKVLLEAICELDL